MGKNRIILGGIACLALFGAVTAPALAAGTVDGVSSDTTGPVVRTVGGQYRFTVTPRKGAGVGYTAGNGDVLGTFAAGRPARNADGTTTYYYGFKCLSQGDTGVYVRTAGKTVRLFTVHVSPDYQAIQDAVDNGHQPWRLDPGEVGTECVAEHKLQAKTDTWSDPDVKKNSDGTMTVIFKKDGRPTIEVVVYQPFERTDSIWAARRWTDLTTGVSRSAE